MCQTCTLCFSLMSSKQKMGIKLIKVAIRIKICDEEAPEATFGKSVTCTNNILLCLFCFLLYELRTAWFTPRLYYHHQHSALNASLLPTLRRQHGHKTSKRSFHNLSFSVNKHLLISPAVHLMKRQTSQRRLHSNEHSRQATKNVHPVYFFLPPSSLASLCFVFALIRWKRPQEMDEQWLKQRRRKKKGMKQGELGWAGLCWWLSVCGGSCVCVCLNASACRLKRWLRCWCLRQAPSVCQSFSRAFRKVALTAEHHC